MEYVMESVLCQCDRPVTSNEATNRSVAEYLRDLADRVEGGEIRHTSVSVHPKVIKDFTNHAS